MRSKFVLNYFSLKMRCSRKNNVYLKKSVCRKNPNTVGIRQRQKIRSGIRRNYIRLAQSIREKNELFIKDLTEKEHYLLKEGFISLSPYITLLKAHDHMISSDVKF